MTNYHVSFFKDLINSNGRPFKTWQGSIEIHSARTRERAIQAAQRRFARLRGVSNWVLYADRLEIEALPEKAASARPSARTTSSHGLRSGRHHWDHKTSLLQER